MPLLLLHQSSKPTPIISLHYPSTWPAYTSYERKMLSTSSHTNWQTPTPKSPVHTSQSASTTSQSPKSLQHGASSPKPRSSIHISAQPGSASLTPSPRRANTTKPFLRTQLPHDSSKARTSPNSF